MDREQFAQGVYALRKEGKSIRTIARELGTYKSKVQRALKTLAERSNPAVHTSDLNAGVFVGRQSEMDELSAALDDTLSGSPRIVMLSGEPGIGKTRLAQEVGVVAADNDVQTLWGRCYEGQGAPSYWPWVQIIRFYVRQGDAEQLRLEMGTGAADIAEIVPELKAKLPGLNPPTSLDSPDANRFRLFDSITSFFKNSAQSKPMILVLEDLHWADRPSLLLLEFLAHEISSSQILIVGTLRHTESEHALSQTIGELARVPYFQQIHLPRLELSDVGHYILETTGAGASDELTDAIYSRTEGNPFFMTEMVRLLGHDPLTGGQSEGFSDDILMPDSVRGAIRRRLEGLSETCNQALTIASLIGREFRFDVVDSLMTDIPAHELSAELEEAKKLRIIDELDDEVGRYQFSHVLIQEAVSDDLSFIRRTQLHARIAEGLEKLYGAEKEEHASELARHYVQTEPVVGMEKLVYYSLLAGERALTAYAWEEAQAHFERALVAKEERVMDTDKAALLFGLGRAQLALHQQDAAIDTLTRAFDYYAGAGEVTKAGAIVGSHLPRGWAQRMMGPLVSKALAILPPDSKEAAGLFSSYGVSKYLTAGDYNAAQTAFERGLTIARREGDVALEVRILAHAVQVDAYHLNWQECLENSLQVIELALKVSDPYAEWEGRNFAAISLAFMGRIEEAWLQANAKNEVASNLRDRFLISGGLLAQQVLSQLVGDFESARDACEASLAGVAHLGSLVLRTLMEHELGDVAEGKKYMERLLERATTEPIYLGSDVGWFAVISLVGRITENESHFDICKSAANTVLSSMSATRVERVLASLSLALMAAQVADIKVIEEHWGILESSRGQMLGAGNAILVNADRILGLLAHAMGKLEDSQTYFEYALAFCRNAGYWPELAWSCYDYAALQHARGQRAQALTLLEEAVVVSTELGMRPLMKRVGVLREQVESMPAKAHVYPAGLTAREVEVLLLMAQGKTSREIANELVISPRTVQRHTTNLYGKINARNRAEATAFALNNLTTST